MTGKDKDKATFRTMADAFKFTLPAIDVYLI